MNLKEIVNMDESIPVSQDECCFVIREYIRVRKGVSVKPFCNGFDYLREVSLMMHMFNYSVVWFRTKPNFQ